MTKTIIKEAGIVILLLISVALVLGIVFYDYIPNSKTVPAKTKPYALPEDIKEELGESVTAGQNTVITYYLDDTDLNAYESNKEYQKGKPNPFGDSTSDSRITSNTINNSSSSNQAKNNTTQGNTNSETYFNTPGKNY